MVFGCCSNSESGRGDGMMDFNTIVKMILMASHLDAVFLTVTQVGKLPVFIATSHLHQPWNNS
jgi:hypothetical protein